MRILVTSLLLAVIMAGCAKPDNGDGIATAGGQTTTTATSAPPGERDKDAPFKHAQCMRDYGVPNFPDPKVNTEGGVQLDLPEGVDEGKLKAAEEKCRKLQPGGEDGPKASPEMIEAARKMAQCMRDSGFPNFPDPDQSGGIAIKGGKDTGLDPKDPKFQEAHKKCEKFMPKPPGGGAGGQQTGTNG